MKRKFAATVWQEGAFFIAQCLEVEVASQGESEKVAVENLREALALHFESPGPVPVTHKVTLEVEINAAQN